jgi:very-short-patch-repair endonuclease
LRGKDHKHIERARSLRRALTPAESALWRSIRGRQLGGLKFVRQEPVAQYYVDFVCREQRLIIELDEVVENLDGVLQTVLSELKR